MSLKKNVAANYIGSLYVAVTGIVFIPLYIKYLGLEAFGLIGFFAILQAALSLFDAGMTPALSREMSRFSGGAVSEKDIRNLLRSFEIILLFLALAYFVSVFSLSNWLAVRWLKIETIPVSEAAASIKIMGFVVAMRMFESLHKGVLSGLQAQVSLNTINIIVSTLRSIGSLILMIFISNRIIDYFIWQAAVSIFSVVAFIFSAYGALPKSSLAGCFSVKSIKSVWRYAAGIFVTTSLGLLLTQLDKVILSKFLSLAEFGRFSVVATISTALITLIIPVVQAFFPRLVAVESQGNRSEFERVFHMGSQLIAVVASVVAGMIFFFGDRLLIFWITDRTLLMEMLPLLSVFILGSMLNCIMNMPVVLPLVRGNPGINARINLIAVCLMVPLNLIFIPVYGARGAAWVWFSLNLGYLLLASHALFCGPMVDQKKSWLIKDTFLPCATAFVVIGFMYFFGPNAMEIFPEILYILTIAFFAVLSAAVSSSEIRVLLRTFFFGSQKRLLFDS